MKYEWLVRVLFIGIATVLFAVASKANIDKTGTQYFSKEEVKSDFDELYQRLKKAHYNLYAHRAKEEFDQRFLELKQSIDGPMTLSKATILFQKLASFANIAHTKVDLPTDDYAHYRKSGGKAFPLFVKVIKGRVYIVENYSDNNTLKTGDEIIGLNNQGIKSVLDGLRQYISADTDSMFYGFLEFQFPMLLWFEYGNLERYEVAIKSEKEQKTLEIQTISYDSLIAKMKQQKGLLELGFERKAKVINQTGYLRPGPFFNTEQNAQDIWDSTSFNKFIDDAFTSFEQAKVQALLIDLRNNPGGNNSFSDYMVQKFANKDFTFSSDFKVKVSSEFITANEKRLTESSFTDTSKEYRESYKNLSEGDIFHFEFSLNKALPEIFEKPVFILVNRHSYSNAVTTAALAQDYGFATILGEKTNDMATTYGAMEAFNLSKTKVAVSFPKAHIIRPNGEKKAHGLMPDIKIETPLVEFAEDRVLKEALLKIKAKI